MTRPLFRSLPLAGLMLASMFAACSAEKPAETPAETKPIAELGIKNLSTPQDHIVCSGQPTEAQFDSLKDAGITRVIHLRQAKEGGTGWEEERAKSAGVEFVRLEIAGKVGLTKDNVQKFHDLMAKGTGGKTLVSCGSSNRVGALLALEAFWIGKKPREEALALGKKSGMTRLTAAVEELTK